SPSLTPTRNNVLRRYRSQVVRLRCEITGNPIPNYTWYKNDQPLTNTDNKRVNAKATTWGSRLKISDLEPGDSGSYTCKASNQFGKEETTGVLTVLN
ncbi:unnamed protein product, partial [Candidula unifasciata]